MLDSVTAFQASDGKIFIIKDINDVDAVEALRIQAETYEEAYTLSLLYAQAPIDDFSGTANWVKVYKWLMKYRSAILNKVYKVQDIPLDPEV